MTRAMSGHAAYKDRQWERQPAAERALNEVLGGLLENCREGAAFRQRLLDQCAVRLRDIVDHIAIDDPSLLSRLEGAGWRESPSGAFEHKEGMFPAFVLREGVPTLWLRVECAADFARAVDPALVIEGAEHGPARRAVVFQSKRAALGVFERNGHVGYGVPDTDQRKIAAARTSLQAFRSRRREFDTVEEGLERTGRLIDAVVAEIGKHWACDLWLKAEREFWMRRCAPGRRQKERQDAAGIGWANIDHHTYDSSRAYFRETIRALEKLGYELREMLYAGDLAGWGSQVLEQPAIGSTIFADVDLAPEELTIDFAHEELAPLPRRRRAGLVSAMHGESILEAGLNHVAGLYDRRRLSAQLAAEGVKMMAPFSDFPHLYQELTIGDWGAVDPSRIDRLEKSGDLPAEEAEKIRLEGAIVTHLENIERNDGFKGFNRLGIDGVLRKLDPRAYAADRRVAE